MVDSDDDSNVDSDDIKHRMDAVSNSDGPANNSRANGLNDSKSSFDP